jgi:excinuclease ABC subunit C
VFFIRDGKVSGREHYFLKNTDDMDRSEIMSSFIKQFYDSAPYVPKEIILDVDMEEKDVLMEWLSEKRGNKVSIVVPSRGKKKDLVDMVYENALEALKNDVNLKMERQKNDAVSELSNLIGIDYAERIEAFDISNIRGTDNVASMVVFVDGKPHRSSYRKFIIKTVEGQDDYGSMREVISRRISHGLKEQNQIETGELKEDKAKFHIMPDLILVDGGLGHVKTAIEALQQLNVEIPVYGMVKDSKHRTRGLVSPDGEIDMPMTGKAFRLVAEIQDEAHRFAITFHKDTKSKKLRSDLLNIPGIGEKRMKALYKAFKTIDGIKNATVDELKKVEGMNEKAANAVYDYFRSH